MTVLLAAKVEVTAPARSVWHYVTDWRRQGEWIPLTRVEPVGSADGVGGRVRAWTGLGRVGFWDPMTITAWEPAPDGSGRCEVLHTGRLVRGTGEFTVTGTGRQTCTFEWSERLRLPAGRLGELAWGLLRPLAGRLLQRCLRRMADRVESPHAGA